MSIVTMPRSRLRLKHPPKPERAMEVLSDRMDALA
jgi:hypothetical protein